METEFKQLNVDWNADPNSPAPKIALNRGHLWLSFFPSTRQFSGHDENKRMFLKFAGCSRFRVTAVNDEGWYRGQCRFSGIAPSWGEFFEVTGDFKDTADSELWIQHSPLEVEHRNFLFYLRDETFECSAREWALGNDDLQDLIFGEPEVFLTAIQKQAMRNNR